MTNQSNLVSDEEQIKAALKEKEVYEELRTYRALFMWSAVVSLLVEQFKREDTPRENALKFINSWEQHIEDYWEERNKEFGDDDDDKAPALPFYQCFCEKF